MAKYITCWFFFIQNKKVHLLVPSVPWKQMHQTHNYMTYEIKIRSININYLALLSKHRPTDRSLFKSAIRAKILLAVFVSFCIRLTALELTICNGFCQWLCCTWCDVTSLNMFWTNVISCSLCWLIYNEYALLIHMLLVLIIHSVLSTMLIFRVQKYLVNCVAISVQLWRLS